MTQLEREQAREHLYREIARITHDPERRNRVRRSIFALESLIDPVAAEILDPHRAEMAFALLGQLFSLTEQEAQVPR